MWDIRPLRILLGDLLWYGAVPFLLVVLPFVLLFLLQFLLAAPACSQAAGFNWEQGQPGQNDRHGEPPC